jgi:nucleotide-binding universal stress UspA family protein
VTSNEQTQNINDGGRRRLLIAYDGSDPARAAVRVAGAIFPAAEAVIAHAYDPPARPQRAYAAGAIPNEPLRDSFAELEREVLDEARATVEDGRALAIEAGLVAETALLPARRGIWQELVEAAHERTADLVVSGSRGRGAFGRALLGSVSSSLLHEGGLPLLIVPAGEYDVSGPILFAYDGSDGAREALATLGRLLPGGRIVLVHAWEWPGADSRTVSGLEASLPEIREIIQLLENWAEERARDVAEEGRRIAEDHGLAAEAETVETIDGAWRAIASAAEGRNAAMIAVGSRGRGRLTSSLLGSVSTALAHNLERPTLVIRP